MNPAVLKFNSQLLLDLGDGSGSRLLVADNEPSRATYTLFIKNYTPPATPTDILTITPLAGRIARVKSLIITGTATAASNIIVQLFKRSTANTGGTSATKLGVARDSNNDLEQASVQLYSANPTALGTAINGNPMDGGRLNIAPAANGSIDRLVFQYSWLNDQANILRPNGENLALNLGGAAWPAGGALDMQLMWTEELQ